MTMNYMVLQKGDAIYIPADGIHTYLSGDIVECMARSDNVLNTGFCPRVDRDSVELFTSTLTFSPHSPEDAILKPTNSDKGLKGRTKVLVPPMSEFDMLVTELKAGQRETIKALQGPSILVVTSGAGTSRLKARNMLSRRAMSFLLDIIPSWSLQLWMVWRLT
jgi:mannose-6-phosphate isomerase